MTELLTTAQMRAIEKAAIASGKVTGLELMERAGNGVVEAIFEEWPDLAETSHKAVVLCGPGNNGGDGFVVARLLKDRGWEVEVFLYGDAQKLPPDARVNYERWSALGSVAVADDEEITAQVESLERGAIAVDALFGTGLARPFTDLEKSQLALNDAAHFSPGEPCYPSVVAIDIPSGFDGNSGRLLCSDPVEERNFFAFAPRANLTVTFHTAKLGHLLASGAETCGSLHIVDIGLPKSDQTRIEIVAHVEARRSSLNKQSQPHKYTHGHALILSGGPGKTGAARLAARGALRIGAGLVTVACPKPALAEVAFNVTAIMTHALDGVPGLREMLEDHRLNALCLGPGLGLGPDTQALVVEALKSKRACVLDADALTRFQSNPTALLDLLHEACVLTPHAGEFKRLFPDIAKKLAAPAITGPAFSKVDATREAATRAGCTVLFKGPDTVIADQTGRCAINSSAYDRAAPWLATAGSGDVLAGFIAGLLARGFTPMEAAGTAAWLHTECALAFGPGLIAEDLPEELPRVFRQIHTSSWSKHSGVRRGTRRGAEPLTHPVKS